MQTDKLVDNYKALLGISESIISHRDLQSLFQDIAKYFGKLLDFEAIFLTLYDPTTNMMRRHVLEIADSERKSLFFNSGMPIEFGLDESPSGLVWKTQQPYILSHISEETQFPIWKQWFVAQSVNSLCMLPLTTVSHRLGVMGFGSFKEYAFSQIDLEFLQQAVKLVAVAVDSTLNYQKAKQYQQELTHERDTLRLILNINNAIVSNLDLQSLFLAIASCLRLALKHDYTSLALYDEQRDGFTLHALDFPKGKGYMQPEMKTSLNSPAGLAFKNSKPLYFNSEGLSSFNSEVSRSLIADGIRSICCIPLISHSRKIGTINLGSLRDDFFSKSDVELLEQVSNQIAIAIENALAFRQIDELKNRLAQEKLYLEGEIRTDHNFEEIIGESTSLKRVLKQIEIVAPTDSAVLIQGETGTGKELIARALHNLSKRKDKTFIKINCAAIPTGLLESELFGHEKGAFTGAIAQKIGRFELAHRGTLFLDEVGDIPLELQPKLLRVLQEQEFERLGSTRTIHCDVRLVAATNRDLLEMVSEKQFRSDLFYRLNVFPVTLPSLKERPEDIPLLVRYFVQKYARQMNKQIDTIPVNAINAMRKYQWPGNIRELENFIERAVILSSTHELNISVSELNFSAEVVPKSSVVTLEDAEREHILQALRESNWVIGGSTGAANRLGMKRTTLQSKMQRLGIYRPS